MADGKCPARFARLHPGHPGQAAFLQLSGMSFAAYAALTLMRAAQKPSRFRQRLYRNYRTYLATKCFFKARVTLLGWLVLSGLVITAALGADTNLSAAYQIFAFLFVLILVSAVTVRFCRARFTIERALPRFGSAGVPLGYRLVLRNTGRAIGSGNMLMEDLPDPIPSFEEFASTPEPGEEQRNFLDRYYLYYRWLWLVSLNQAAQLREYPVPPVPKRGATEMRLELTPLRRGVLRLKGVRVACPDPFGLFRSVVTVAAPQTVLILPKRYPLPPLVLPGSRQYQLGGVALASSIGESEEFISLRDYRPGDPLRHIHWRSWAKTGRPIVKEFEDEFIVRHALILDTFSDVPRSQLFEEAVSVAASFACTIETQDSLLDLMFVGPQAYCFTTGRSLAHREQMLEILAAVNSCRNDRFESLHQLVLAHVGTLSGCVMVLLAWDEARRALVAQLRALDIPVWVFVLVEPGQQLDPGPLADEPHCFRPLELGRVAVELATL